jgi:signal transduction histidine kinase
MLGESERRLQRAEMALRLHGECKRLIIRADDEVRLLGGVCDRIAEIGGYPLAWVGVAHEDPQQTITPIVAAGPEADAIRGERLSWAEGALGKGVAGEAIRARAVRLAHGAPVSGAAPEGFASSVAVPLFVADELIGALVVHSRQEDAFETADVRLLEELAADMGFGIRALRIMGERMEGMRRLARSEQTFRDLAEKIDLRLEEEKSRIARELHDDLGQDLTILRMDIGRMRADARKRGEDDGRLEELRVLVDEIIAKLRNIATELRPVILDQFGLDAAVEWHVEKLRAKTGLRIEIERLDGTRALSRRAATALFRMFQEAMTNVLRHARASSVAIRLEVTGERLALSVKDDGLGISPEGTAGTASFGILSMRERARSLGGEFSVSPAPGGGTLLRVAIPLPDPAGRTGP